MNAGSPFATATVTNPTAKDFTTQWNKFPIVIPANSFVSLPENIARHAAKHLAQRILLDGGRYEDVYDGQKVTSRAVSRDFRGQLAENLINRDLDVDVDAVFDKVSGLLSKESGVEQGKEVKRRARAEGKPITTLEKPVVDNEDETVEDETVEDEDKAEWERLQAVGYNSLKTPEERARYSELKAIFKK